MATAMSSHFQSALPVRRLLLVGAGGLAVAALAAMTQIGAPDYSDLAANREVEMHTARLPAASLAEVTRQSDAVVVGRVLRADAVHFIQADGQQPQALRPDARLAGLSKSKDAASLLPAPRSQDGILSPPSGIPVTDFSIQVSDVLRGKVGVGSTITVSQPGGQISLPKPAGSTAPTLVRTLVAEHDPLMVPGQEQVLFLQQAKDGTFHVTSGPDGRFSLDAKRTLKPIDEAAPVGAAQKGQSLQDLAAQIRTITGGGNAQ